MFNFSNRTKLYIWGFVGSILLLFITVLFLKFFSEESQNKFSRMINTTIGLKHGCVEVYAGQAKPVIRFLGVEKLSTAMGTEDNLPRPYRFGFGFHDANLNGVLDTNEKNAGKVYFETPDYAQYIYYDKKL